MPELHDDLSMFGELEDAPDDCMVVRAIGYVLGTANGWYHYGGLSVIFSAFRTKHPTLAPLVENVAPEHVCLAIDFYTGEVKIVEMSTIQNLKVLHSLQLNDLLPLDKR